MQHFACASEGGRNALYESVVVLIVEDDHALAEFIRDLLTAEGYVAVIAATPCTAAAEAVTVGADVVLLDLMMPTCTGWDVAASLRSDPRTAHIPIIVMTAGHRLVLAMQEIGTLFGLFKPFNTVDLVNAIARALPAAPQGTAA